MAKVARIDRQVTMSSEPVVVYDEELFRTGQLVDYILGVVEVVLGLRFVLKLFGANPAAWLVKGVYSLTDPLMAPFRAVFHSTTQQGATFEWSVIVAMVVYMLLALAIIRLIEIFSERA